MSRIGIGIPSTHAKIQPAAPFSGFTFGVFMSSGIAGSMPELEAALAAQPDDRELLAVYADALMARGEPRGELIALDLHVERAGGATSALWARREELERAVLGRAEAALPAARLRRGFLELDYDVIAHERDPDDLLDRPIVQYLRRFRLVADQPGPAVSVLVRALEQPRPHLTSLALVVGYGEVELVPGLEPDILPRLRTLSLGGYTIPAAASAHPGVETLELAGRAAFEWAVACPVHPGVETLVMEVGRGEHDLARQITRRRFPRCHTVELRMGPHHADTEPVEFAEATELFAEGLRKVIVPGTFDDILRRRLASIAPHAAIEDAIPPPWPRADTLRAGGMLAIEIPGVAFTGHVPVGPMLAVMESYFRDMPPAARSAWEALWRLHGRRPVDVGHGDRARLPALLLATALDALPPHVLAKLRPWQSLRAALGAEPSRRLDVMISPFRKR